MAATTKTNPSPTLKPNDIVRTPSGRTARVLELRPDGKRDLQYLDEDGGEVALDQSRLVLVQRAPVLPWKTRKAPS